MVVRLTLNNRTLTWTYVGGRQMKKGTYPTREMAVEAYMVEALNLGAALSKDSGIIN